jgi:hypothetical protein
MLDSSSGFSRYAIQSDTGLSLNLMVGKLPSMTVATRPESEA